MEYVNLDIEASGYRREEDGESFRVRVLDSPVGQQRLGEEVRLQSNVRQRSRMLETRSLRLQEMISLGESLAGALFPPAARSFLDRSRSRVPDRQGLRIRLKLDSLSLANLPWEYAYISCPDTPADQKRLTGFLVLDPRISLVRYELLGTPSSTLTPVGSGTLRIVAFLASPENLPRLNLKAERENIENALRGIDGVAVEFKEASLETMQDALARNAHIFHFAGHGGFENRLSETVGYLAFEGPGRTEVRISAEKLAMNLKSRGVRLAFLGACEAGRRDGENAWSGIAPALTQAEIPAVLGMQFTIKDENAIAFSNRFYRDLFTGDSIDAAVNHGRLAIFNTTTEDERDWGVPVLYLRATDGVLFPKQLPRRPPGEAERSPAEDRRTEEIGTGIDELAQLMQKQVIRESVLEFRIVFKTVRRQSAIVAQYKELHDQLDDLQTLCYERIVDEAEHFTEDASSRRRLIDHKRQLQKIVRTFHDIARSAVTYRENEWINDLDGTRQKLEQALETSDRTLLDEVKSDLREVLETRPADINRRLVDAAANLNLSELVAAMQSVLSKIDPDADRLRVKRFKAGVDALGCLNQRLSVLIHEHDQWQDVDRRLRLIEASITQSIDQLESSWKRLKFKIENLCSGNGLNWATDIGSDDDWVTEIMDDIGKLQISIEARDVVNERYVFRAIRDKAGDRFLRVDKALRRLCSDELRPTGERLDAVLEIIE